MQTRIYKVQAVKPVTAEQAQVLLVEAASAAQAIRHIVADKWTAEVATAKDVAHLAAAGTKIQLAGTAAN